MQFCPKTIPQINYKTIPSNKCLNSLKKDNQNLKFEKPKTEYVMKFNYTLNRVTKFKSNAKIRFEYYETPSQ